MAGGGGGPADGAEGVAEYLVPYIKSTILICPHHILSVHYRQQEEMHKET